MRVLCVVGKEGVWLVGSCAVAPWQGGHGVSAAFLSLISAGKITGTNYSKLSHKWKRSGGTYLHFI